jgi:hypothetical protein
MKEKHQDHTSSNEFKVPQLIKYDPYTKTPPNFSIHMEYADDISSISDNPNITNMKKKYLTPKLTERKLTINESKSEYYIIERNGDESWKKCKFLGSLLDTDCDITRRKGLAVAAITNMKHIFQGNLPIETKVRAFHCFISSIFLYNCELWTLTDTLTSSIDAFHRRLLRTACVNIKWPKIITNVELYTITKAKPWSVVIRKRQLSWYGHLVRLPEDTPAKLALRYAQVPVPKPRGRPKLTWQSMMVKLFSKLGTCWNEAFECAKDRKKWNYFIKRSALDYSI